MPVLPLVGSITRAPGWRSAPSSMAFATRSLIDPVGFWPSSFAYILTDGFGEKWRSSTSGVLPTKSTSEDATPLCTTLPDVDRRAEFAEQLVDAPREPAGRGGDGVFAVSLGELRVTAPQAREPEQVLPDVPPAVLEHPLAPFGAEALD